jgi:hypothetical protein
VIKYFWLKQWGTKATHHELQDTLRDVEYSLFQVKYWMRKFKNGDLDFLDDLKHRRPLSGLGAVPKEFLKQ